MRRIIVILGLAATGSAFAQHAGHHQPQPIGYAGMHTRDIKALSPEQVADLREGRGMGASLPAELNGAPGPIHVLELSQQLKVTPGMGLRVYSPIGPIRIDLAYGPSAIPAGPVYYRPAVLGSAGSGRVYCVSPGNILDVDLSGTDPVQEPGQGPAAYAPPVRGGFFQRLRFHLSIGQAF